MLQTVRNGSRNVDVALLQALLNKARATPQLTVDGIFGSNTETALRDYQTSNASLNTDGVAGPLTWGTFPNIREIRHNTTLRAQTGTMGCWSAAAGMVSNAQMSHGAGNAATGAGGGLNPNLGNVETFAAGLGWRIHNNQSVPPVTSIADAMVRNPVWIGLENQSSKHAVVFSKLLTDGTNEGTAFEVQDPWPVGRGTTYYSGYANGLLTLRSVAHRPQVMIVYVVGP
ncbi:peptidoglycan-binding protein [Roseibium sp.]|uniref:peptidoglycan-binding domain-containing protein n=1 Tax=Roseibium sp. TaxID=1936156 RepID=UPI003B501E83